MFVFIVSVLLYLYLSVSLLASLYITILSVLPEWRINFIIYIGASTPSPLPWIDLCMAKRACRPASACQI